jgi:outer membrane receptor protein involved in Fe transport
MTFGCDNFVINSDFAISTYGAALYHQSVFNLDRWQITAGLRLDMEHVTMRYNSNATIPYRFDLTMDNYRDLLTEFKGRDSQTFFEVLPKIAVRYTLNSRNNIYATITRGYKSGGFNTQIFSDILQVKMMSDMMDALGIELDNGATTTTYNSASATRYKPEKSWNFELGTHLQPLNGLSIDAALFWIECFDQQVTVLPKGMSTGRMMSNAARARSLGLELAAEYNYKGLSASVGYGYTNARFRDYDDGMESYGGNVLPYAPQNTINALVGYTWHIADSRLEEITITADWRGIGRIYWNESNTLSQPLYSLLGMQLSLGFKKATLTIWGRNLTNSDYDTFYFKSVGKEFFSKGAPIHGGIRVNINI